MKTKLFTLFIALAAGLAPIMADPVTVVLSDVANYIDFQALSVSDPDMTQAEVTSFNPYELANGTRLVGYMKSDGVEQKNIWKDAYDFAMPTPTWEGVDSLKAGTMFRAASGTTIELGAFYTDEDGKLVVYYQPNGDAERGISISVFGENVEGTNLTGSGQKIDGKRPAYAAEITLPAGAYDIGDVVIKLVTNTSNIFGVRIEHLSTYYSCVYNGIRYNLDKTSNTATVTFDKNKYSGNIIIPSSITHSDRTFSVTSIGNGAFAGCTELSSITIPNSVTSIGKEAFYGCTMLQHLSLGEGVESIGSSAFANCPYIVEFTAHMILPPAITADVFTGWGDLKEVTLYVHQSSVALYKKIDVWKEFSIQEIANEGAEAIVHYLDKDGISLHSERFTFNIPDAPTIKGFTFLRWDVIGGAFEDGINIQAIYEANEPTSAPKVVNPANKAQKLIRNGNVYILTNTKTYNVQGLEVK